jgi:Flp pilus assembly protein CpaB
VENITSSKLFRTRQGTILLGVAAAVLAAIALIVYLNQYRNSVNKTGGTTAVLVAKSAIPKNTTGEVITSSTLYKTEQFAQDKVPSDAILDPSDLAGQVAVTAIPADQPLTTSDFAASGSSPVVTQLSRGQRAVVVPLDTPGTVGGQVTAGDSVDVFALIDTTSTPVAREILRNMYVLNTDSSGNVTLRATPKQAGELIYASSNDKLWLTLRPANGSVAPLPNITSKTLLGG